jgi:hypothetical protein
MFGKDKNQERIVRNTFGQVIHSISTEYTGYITFNGRMTINIETLISIVYKEDNKGNKWAEFRITQPNVLIEKPTYDCEFSTNDNVKAILSIDEVKAKKWVASNCMQYVEITNAKGIKLYIPW